MNEIVADHKNTKCLIFRSEQCRLQKPKFTNKNLGATFSKNSCWDPILLPSSSVGDLYDMNYNRIFLKNCPC